jgi:putative membrane protein
VLFAVPSYVALWKWAGRERAVKVLCALGGFAFGIETFAILTGWPYGEFSYGDKIGAKLGLVPWTVPFAWTPLVLGAWALSGRLNGRAIRSKYFGLLFPVLLLMAFDLVLDPGAVSQQFWVYRFPGVYYGVPFSNYFGWLLSGSIGVALMRWLLNEQASEVPPSVMMTSVAWILSFWTGVGLFSNLWVPSACGFVLLFTIGLAARLFPSGA